MESDSYHIDESEKSQERRSYNRVQPDVFMDLSRKKKPYFNKSSKTSCRSVKPQRNCKSTIPLPRS